MDGSKKGLFITIAVFVIIMAVALIALKVILPKICPLRQEGALQESALVKAPTPTDAEGYFKQGRELYYKKKYDDAIKSFNKAISMKRDYAQAYCELGVCYMEKQDFKRAVEKLKKAIDLNPKYPKAEYAIAVSYARMKPPDAKLARSHFEKAKSLGYRAPEWFERFLKSLEAGSGAEK